MRMMPSIRLLTATVALATGMTATVQGQQQTFAPAAPPVGSRFAYQWATTEGVPVDGTYITASPTLGSTFTLRAYLIVNDIAAAYIGTPQQATLSNPANPASAPNYIANSGTGQGGIFGASVRATYGPGTAANPNTGTAGVISVTSASNGIGINLDSSGNTALGQQTAFNDPATSLGTRAISPTSGVNAGNNYAQFIAVTDSNAPSTIAVPVAGLYLGSYKFTIQGVPGASTNLKAEDIPIVNTFRLKSGFDLDAYVNPANLRVVIGFSVPEPASILGVAGLGLIAVRRLRRKA